MTNPIQLVPGAFSASCLGVHHHSSPSPSEPPGPVPPSPLFVVPPFSSSSPFSRNRPAQCEGRRGKKLFAASCLPAASSWCEVLRGAGVCPRWSVAIPGAPGRGGEGGLLCSGGCCLLENHCSVTHQTSALEPLSCSHLRLLDRAPGR